MTRATWRLGAAATLLCVATAGQGALAQHKAAAPARSEADVNFMAGMIPHHAQAVLMAGWAASHGARPDVAVLCERIVVGQKDEIALMQYWLRQHGETVPSATDTRMKMKGMPDMLMPGMMSDEEMAALDKARGPEFDRLFMEGMIRHHQGAVAMVDELLASKNAAQNDVVYKMASDIYADQTTEIDRMQKMLAKGPAGSRAP
ncbi:MAG: hypothetical protein JWM95_5632 [Gemmatimonadetes bacterium]|nr:hypothetical protein [Gemmatimonadota bacterium]